MGEILSMSKYGKSKLGKFIDLHQLSQQYIADICSVRRETVNRWLAGQLINQEYIGVI